MKRETKTLAVNVLKHAEWNPRTEAELKWDHPEMVTLVESVRALGVIQPVAVWDRSCDETMVVIAGNRRLEAAIAVGLKTIPAIVFEGITEGQAREITRVENEVRLGVDPLQDAALIGSMLSLGYSQKEIAAHFGTSEAKICRRAKLLTLSPSVRAVQAEFGNISTDALERIALYPESIQEACAGAIRRVAKRDGESSVKWSAIKYNFDYETKDLANAKFSTDGCVGCAKRTGAQADLFGENVADGQLGQCLDGACYKCKVSAYNAMRVAEQVGSDVELVDGEAAGVACYNVADRPEFSNRRTKKATVAWWWCSEYQVEPMIYWGPSLAAYREIVEAEKAREEAERVAREEEAKRNAEANKAKEAERARRQEERAVMYRSLEEAHRVIRDKWNKLDDEQMEKVVRKHIIGSALKGKTAGLVANAVTEYLGSYQIGYYQMMNWVETIPAFAKALKITTAEIKTVRAARQALIDFDAEVAVDGSEEGM